jgi:hypothetical protein
VHWELFHSVRSASRNPEHDTKSRRAVATTLQTTGKPQGNLPVPPPRADSGSAGPKQIFASRGAAAAGLEINDAIPASAGAPLAPESGRAFPALINRNQLVAIRL